ncbi:MAG: hypothetical protein KIH01_00770 [Candidatus Freyarchaeota archaeon]|nr:hypothetical protein [Candidatus Jordarchaeia archaeon]
MTEKASKKAKGAKVAERAGEGAEGVKEIRGEVAAAPKFKQPWDGLLSFFTVFIWAYLVLQVFIHPVWGVATKMVRMNAFIASMPGMAMGNAELGLLLSLSNALNMELYPLGYIVDWVPYFIFCIVWFVTITVLARPFTPSRAKQPQTGIMVTALSMILAFVTWYILAMVLHWKGYEMIILATCCFLVFPIWATLFHYWPFVPKKPNVHPAVRGAVYAFISWILAFIIRGVVTFLIWSNPVATAFTQYLYGVPMVTLTPTEPYDFYNSLLLCIIVGAVAMSVISPFPSIPQPKRGLLNLGLAILAGVAMWGILTAVIGQSSQTVLLTAGSVPYLFTFPYVNHGAIAAYMAFPLVTLLAGQLTFGMWPWSRWGMKGSIALVVVSFVVGTILYYIFMVNPGMAVIFTGANLLLPVSGLETVYMFYLGIGLMLSSTGAIWNALVYCLYFEGVAEFLGRAVMFAWMLTVLIFFMLAYEAFEHWPWR